MAGLLRRLTGRGAAAVAGEPPGTLELRGNGTRVVLVPALGGRITALEIGGREWLRAGGIVDERFPSRLPFADAAAASGAEPPPSEPSSPDDAAAQHAEVHVET
ncbi:MAG TPA: hypothetical protein VFZ11_15085, partial [Gemmatimonadaceae bacterium]